MRLTDSAALASGLDRLFEHTVPLASKEREGLPCGAVWLGCSVDLLPGFAVYTNLEWCGDEQERWTRAFGWLEQTATGFSSATLTPCMRDWAPFAAGLEGHQPHNAYAKLYMRQAGNTAFRLTKLRNFLDPVVEAFCLNVIQGRILPVSGIVLSAEFSILTGRLTGMKLDICGHCTPRSTVDWLGLLEKMSGMAHLRPLPIDWGDAHRGIEVAFIGLGRREDHDYRLNLYLKHSHRGDLYLGT